MQNYFIIYSCIVVKLWLHLALHLVTSYSVSFSWSGVPNVGPMGQQHLKGSRINMWVGKKKRKTPNTQKYYLGLKFLFFYFFSFTCSNFWNPSRVSQLLQFDWEPRWCWIFGTRNQKFVLIRDFKTSDNCIVSSIYVKTLFPMIFQMCLSN